MRILQVARVFGSTGGIQTYVARLSESLIRMGHQTVIAAGDVPHGTDGTCELVWVPELAPQPTGDTPSGRRRIADLARSFGADCVLLHHVGDGQLLRILHAERPTVEFVHAFICGGSKLFRRNDRVCNHAVGVRCLLDWYVGPCGSHRSPQAAISSFHQARDYIHALATI